MKLSPELLGTLKNRATSSEWKIRPIKIDDKDYYVGIWNTEAYDLFRKVMAKNSWDRKRHLKRLLKNKVKGLEFIEA